MPRKKAPEIKKTVDPNVVGLKAEVIDQPITETLEKNYMPYAMSVIVSRAIPEIDGFKPSPPQAAVHDVQDGPAHRRRAPSRPTSWARPCASIPTATRRSMRPWCASPGATSALLHALCGLARATSARSIRGTWPMPPPRYTEAKLDADLRRALRRHRQATPSILSTTTTAP